MTGTDAAATGAAGFGVGEGFAGRVDNVAVGGPPLVVEMEDGRVGAGFAGAAAGTAEPLAALSWAVVLVGWGGMLLAGSGCCAFLANVPETEAGGGMEPTDTAGASGAAG